MIAVQIYNNQLCTEVASRKKKTAIQYRARTFTAIFPDMMDIATFPYFTFMNEDPSMIKESRNTFKIKNQRGTHPNQTV